MIVAWVLISLIIAAFGSARKIGFFWSFIICCLLSPVIGIFIVLVSEADNRPAIAFKCKHCYHTTTENHLYCPNCKKDDFGRDFINLQ